MSNKTRLILGVVLIVAAVFLPVIQERIPDFTPKPDDNNVVEPSEEILEKVSSIADKVTDSKDRADMFAFNKVFSERRKDYSVDAQQINDIYTEAGKTFFKGRLRGKYEGLSSGLVGLMSGIIGTENHTITKEEKEKLASHFDGLSWCFR